MSFRLSLRRLSPGRDFSSTLFLHDFGQLLRQYAMSIKISPIKYVRLVILTFIAHGFQMAFNIPAIISQGLSCRMKRTTIPTLMIFLSKLYERLKKMCHQFLRFCLPLSIPPLLKTQEYTEKARWCEIRFLIGNYMQPNCPEGTKILQLSISMLRHIQRMLGGR